MTTASAVKRVAGTCLNAGNGQHLEDGVFTVRELTAGERRQLPACVARLEGPSVSGEDSRVYLSVESATTNGGFYVLAEEP